MLDRRSFLAAAGGAWAAQPRGPRPNLVFILADDLGWKDLSCYGNQYHSTPNLDRLASEGARFTHAYAAAPVCSPTRASILTGRFPARTGITDWIPGRPSPERGPLITPATLRQLRLEETTLAELLRQAGYRTAHIGKWHLGGQGFLPGDQGFDLNIGGTESGSPPRSPRPYFGPFELPGLKAAEGEFLTSRLAAEAVRFIEQNRQNPFFLLLSHFTVHIPLSAPAELVSRHRERGAGRYHPVYAAMVETLDESVGLVLEALKQFGLERNTIVAFFSDNGGLCFEGTSKERVTTNAPLRAGKGHLYEGGIRVPFLLRWPGVARAGATVDTPVSSVDLFPTLCEAAGVRPRGADGTSLLPLLRGGTLHPRQLFWHYPHYSNQGGEPSSAILDGDWKLIEFYHGPRQELYNLRNDPGETRNLAASQQAVAKRLSLALHQWLRQVDARRPQPNPNADPAWSGFGFTGAEPPTPPR
ncbi:MAG: sulfatase [Bryobacteraceae bacterium]